MKTKLILLILAFAVITFNAEAKKVAKVKATSYDISDNLDLEAVASIFADSKDLNDFENRLNNPKNEISNLDLNEDGYIDYLRVVEFTEEETRYITIQSVLGEDVFQDVATIELEREPNNGYSLIIVGNHFIYGADYFIRPVYVYRPTILDFIFGPHYHPWHSPYYWGYYPAYFTYRAPYHIHRYRNHIHHHINTRHHYEYISHRNHHHSHNYYSNYSRNDYGTRHPEKSFEKRNEGVKNRYDLTNNRRSSNPNSLQYDKSVKTKQYNSEVNRRTGASFEKEKLANRTTQTEKKATRSSQRRATEIERSSTKRAEDMPAVREKSTQPEVKSRPNNNHKEESAKMKRNEPRRSAVSQGNSNRKQENTAKKQAVEKKSATENKNTERKSRR